MKYIKGNDRGQIALIPTSLEEDIDENNEVRIIDSIDKNLLKKYLKKVLSFVLLKNVFVKSF